MNSIEALLLEMPQADRAIGCDDTKIRRHCRGFKRLFQCFDALIHYCHQPFGGLSDDAMKEVQTLVPKLDDLWRRLMNAIPPKAHSWWHLLDDLERQRGLKHHAESKMEKSHQIGRHVYLTFRAVNDVDKRIDSSLRCQHTMSKASMQVIQSEVKEARSCKRNQEEDNNVNDRHAQLIALLEMPATTEEFLSVKELALIDRRHELEAEKATSLTTTTDDAHNSE